MNKSEIQERIEKCESEIVSLKADLAKCDCADGIEQEECWHVKDYAGDVRSSTPKTKHDCMVSTFQTGKRQAYMPECRQITEQDAIDVSVKVWGRATGYAKEFAAALHEAGFRMKVTP